MKKSYVVCLLNILLAACSTTPSDDLAPLVSLSEASKSLPPPPMLISHSELAKNSSPMPRRQQEIKLDVFFAAKAMKLAPEEESKLADLLMRAKASSFEAILIEGRSNEGGTPEYRLAIADKRANVVKMFLAKNGLPHGKIQTRPTLEQTWQMPPECKGKPAQAKKDPVCIYPGSPVTVTLKSAS